MNPSVRRVRDALHVGVDLPGWRPVRGGYTTRCPAHDDDRASLSVSEGQGGRALIHCHAGCATEDVLQALGLTMADLMPPAEGSTAPRIQPHAKGAARSAAGGRIVAEYNYQDQGRALLYQVVRFEPKAFRPRRPVGSRWTWNLGDVRRVLYRLPELLAGAPQIVVFIVEGEKDADALTRLGLIATTNAGGAGKWRPEYGDALAGRHVVILPDNDDPGRKHAGQVAAALAGVAASVKVLELRGLPAKGDVTDWLANGGTVEALLKLVDASPLCGQRDRNPREDHEATPLRRAAEYADSAGTEGLRRVAPATVSSSVLTLADVEPRDVDWLWTGRLPAGMVVVFDGQPGAGKSTVVVDLIARLTTGREFPDETPDQRRAPADVVMIGNEDSPEHTIRPRLDAARADAARVHLITDIGGRTPRLPDDGDAIERIVRERGAKLLVLDPVSAHIGQADFHRDNEVRCALSPLATIAERTGATVLMLRHLRKSGGTDALGRGLGSVAITALARAGLMLLLDPDDPMVRVLAWVKLSVGRAPQSLRWRFEGDGDRAPRIEWLGACDLTADTILAAKDRRDRLGDQAGDNAATAMEAAEAWLMNQLEAPGAVPVSDLKTKAMEANHSWRTVERAKGRLGVRANRESDGQTGAGRWLWVAPERKAAKHGRSAALPRIESNGDGNPAKNADLGDVRKTADRQDRQTGLAVLRNPIDDAEELLPTEGVS